MRTVWCSGHVLLALALSLHSCSRLGRQNAPPPAPGVPVGQEAPEIEGTDLEGAPLTLSQQRGKVVALIFWGHW